jgi:hypothetical protein
MKKKFEAVLVVAYAVLAIWLLVSNVIQAYKCPEMTQTELFLHIPESFVCNWNHCN